MMELLHLNRDVHVACIPNVRNSFFFNFFIFAGFSFVRVWKFGGFGLRTDCFCKIDGILLFEIDQDGSFIFFPFLIGFPAEEYFGI